MRSSLANKAHALRRGASLFALLLMPLPGCEALAAMQQSDLSSSAQPSEVVIPVPSTGTGPGQTLNPTGKDIKLIVSARDGSVLLGDVTVTITPDGKLRLPAQRLFDLLGNVVAADKLEALRSSVLGRREIGIDEFSRSGIAIAFNQQTLELAITIPSEMRAQRAVQVSVLDREHIGKFAQPAEFSGYINVRGALDYLSDGPVTGFQDPTFYMDGAVRVGQIVAESEAFWQPGSIGPAFQRQGSRLVYDDLKDLMRFTVGDLQPVARSFQVTPQMAGISVGRSYSTLQPQQVIRPRGNRSFALERPSTVEIYVNGSLIRRLRLNAGNYNLNDFPFTQGANDIRVNITDDSGRQETLRFNIFLDQTQLAKGLTEFGIYVGVKAPLTPSGPDYSGDWVFSGFVRHGFSDMLTLGANFQADKHSQMGGVEAVVGSSIGTFAATAAASHVDGIGEGWAATLSFQRLFQRPQGFADSLSLFVETRSKNFAPVSILLPSNPFQYEVGGSYSHALNERAYVGVDGRYSKGRTGYSDQHYYRLSGGYRLTDRISLTAEARYERNSFRKEFSGLLTLNVRLGGFSSARASYDTVDNRARVSYQTIHGQGVGSYNISADIERSDLGSDINLNANYYTNVGDLGISHFGNFSGDFSNSVSQRTTLRMATSLAFAGGSFAVGRPIYDSFAIVKPHAALDGTRIRIEPTDNGYVADTRPFGTALHPSLNSYSERTITVDAPNAKEATDLGTGTFRVLPHYRSGYLLVVGSQYNMTAIGTLVGAGGKPVSLVSGKITEVGKAEPLSYDMFTNREGRFGIPGLAPGKWLIEMNDDDHTKVEIEIPANSEAAIVRLGTVSPTEGH